MKNWDRIKPKVNLVIDATMFVVLMTVTGLGFLMKYVLLPGYKINEIYGRGVELYFLGLDRHQWGTIHLILALILVSLLVLHIIFHWDMITSIFRQMINTGRVRVLTGTILGIIGLSLAISPFLLEPEVAELKRQHNRNLAPGTYFLPDKTVEYEDIPAIPESSEFIIPHPDPVLPALRNWEPSVMDQDKPAEVHHSHYAQVAIDGTMTLNEISGRYNISVDELAGAIKVPVAYSHERLGRLRKRYTFEMDDLREFVIRKTREAGKNDQ
jgi:hypothetical protein